METEVKRDKLIYVASLINIIFIIGLVWFVASSCTYSVTLAHTEGTATDLIDEVSTNTPTITADVKMPGVL